MLKHFTLSALVLMLVGTVANGQTLRTIREIQDPVSWEADSSKLGGEKVKVRGVVMYPPSEWYQASEATVRYSFWIQERGQSGPRTGLQIRLNSATNADDIGIKTLVAGNFVEVTGEVDYFNGEIQISLDRNTPIQVLEPNVRLAAPAPISVSILNNTREEAQPTGDEWQGSFVELSNLTVERAPQVPAPTPSRGDIIAKDADGNTIRLWDANIKMRTRTGGYVVPQRGMVYTKVRGIVYHRKGTTTNYFEIHPFLFPDHLVTDETKVPPTITSVRRAVACPTPGTPVTVNVNASHAQAGSSITKVELKYAVGLTNTSYQTIAMTNTPGTSDWTAAIPAQPDRSFVHYYVVATDNNGNTTQFPANSPASSATINSPEYYTVSQRGCRISDIQRTSQEIQFSATSSRYNSGYCGYTVTNLTAIVTATNDKKNLGFVFAQEPGESAWAGIRLQGDATLNNLQVGDSIVITEGRVAEDERGTSYFGMTMLIDAKVRKIGPAKNPIRPLELRTSDFATGLASQTIGTEAYEAMLVRIQENLIVIDTMPDPNNISRKMDWIVGPDASSPNKIRVMTGGGNLAECSKAVSYINSRDWVQAIIDNGITPCIVNLNTKFTAITGIMTYDFDRTKIMPRTNADFEGATGANCLQTIRRNTLPNSNLSFYPNPAADMVNVRTSQAGNLYIYDLHGRTVLIAAVGVGVTAVKVADLPAGAYYCRMVTDQGDVFQASKLILNR